MAQKQEEQGAFSGFGLGTLRTKPAEEGVFLLVVSRDGSLTAAAYAAERGAMAAAVESLEDEQEEDGEGGTLEDRFARAQRFITDEGGLMEIIPSPIYGA